MHILTEGGGGTAPKILTVAATASAIAGWDRPWGGMFTRQFSGGMAHCYIADDVWAFVWRSITDNKVKAAIITFDSSGNPTFGAEQDLTAFTTATKGPVWVKRVSATRMLIMSAAMPGSYLTYEWLAYDISGTTITAAAGLSVQSQAMQSVTYDSSAGIADIVVIDENRAVLMTSDYYRTSDSRIYFYGIRFTATQNIAAAVDFGPSGPANGYEEGSTRRTFLQSATKILFGNYYSVSTVDIDASLTPIVSNLVVLTGLEPTAFANNGYQNDVTMVVEPDAPLDAAESFHASYNGFWHFSGETAYESTEFGYPRGMTYNQTLPSAGDHTLVYLAKEGDFHHMFYCGSSGSTLNSRQFCAFAIDPLNNFKISGPKQTPTIDVTSESSESIFGAAIRPKAGATRITCFEYQTAATAGWYFYTLDVA